MSSTTPCYDAAGADDDPYPRAVAGTQAMSRIVGQLQADHDLDTADLIEIAAHCAATTAAAQFRLLQTISLIHDNHAEDYACELGEATTGEVNDITVFTEHAAQALTGSNPRAQYGPDGLQRTIAEVGAVLSIPPAQARSLITTGHALRYRLPLTAAALAVGRIDLRRFEIAVARTLLCTTEVLPTIDAELAEAISSRDMLSTGRFTTMVDVLVARNDPQAIKERRERAHKDRDVRVRPDRFTPGQARMTANLPVASGAIVDARLHAMASSVHPEDPRNMAQRRADALLAFGNGRNYLTCQCHACTAVSTESDSDTNSTSNNDTANRDNDTADNAETGETGDGASQDGVATAIDTDLDTQVSDPADLAAASCADPTGSAATGSTTTGEATSGSTTSEAATSGCTCSCVDHQPSPTPLTPPTPAPVAGAPRPVFHIVANQSTLEGVDDQPGYLDGFGVLDADSMRELFTDAEYQYVDPDQEQAARSALNYVPSKKLAALIRCGELSCVFPGCNNPVWTADVDHTKPFDHDDPGGGGATSRGNLKPLCRFHHRMKTFGRWRDYQDSLGLCIFESPTGHWFVGNAFRGIDMFPVLRPRPPGHRARTAIDGEVERKRRGNAGVREHWAADNPPPF